MMFSQFHMDTVLFVAVATGACYMVGNPLEVNEGKDSVKLTLFYSSTCRHSGAFISSQLYKTWLHFEERLKLELVPVATYVLLSDLLQACAIQDACGFNGTLDCPTPNLKKALDYLNCMADDNTTLEIHTKCATKAGLDLEAVEKCVTSAEGVNLQKKHLKLTMDFKPPIKYVPTIVIDDNHDEKVEEEARNDLMKLISSILK